ncbi:phosphatidylinositol 4,5-bisphosphate-binding protein, partial [Elasticomyces elasticus]
MSRPITPNPATVGRPLSYAPGTDSVDHYSGAPQDTSMLSQGSNMNDGRPDIARSESEMSQSNTMIPTRGNTLKKKSSLRRSGSKKSNYAGSVRSLRPGDGENYEQNEEHNNAFYCPVPVSGSPTDLLADRFQAWRQVLKNLINYFRDLQESHKARAKSLSSAASVLTGA